MVVVHPTGWDKERAKSQFLRASPQTLVCMFQLGQILNYLPGDQRGIMDPLKLILE